jgi:cell division protein FtsL
VTRVNFILLVAVILSALYLVRTQYESRKLVTELYRASAQAHKLEVEYNRLDVERGAEATPVRVEKLAREQLKMHPITPAITLYATQSGAVSKLGGIETVGVKNSNSNAVNSSTQDSESSVPTNAAISSGGAQ